MTTINEDIYDKCEWPNCDQDRVKKIKISAHTNFLEAMTISDKFCKEHQKLFKKIRQKEISIEDYIGKILYKKNKEGWISSLGFEKNYNIILNDLLLVKNKLMLLDDINISHIIKTYDDFKLKKFKKFITDTYWKKKVFKPKKYSKIIDCIYTDKDGVWILKYKPFNYRLDPDNLNYVGRTFGFIGDGPNGRPDPEALEKCKNEQDKRSFVHHSLIVKERADAIKRIENAIVDIDREESDRIYEKDHPPMSELQSIIWFIIGAIITISVIASWFKPTLPYVDY